MKWKIPKHTDLIMTDPWGLGKTMPAEARIERERVKWLEAENKRLEQTNDRLVEKIRILLEL